MMKLILRLKLKKLVGNGFSTKNKIQSKAKLFSKFNFNFKNVDIRDLILITKQYLI